MQEATKQGCIEHGQWIWRHREPSPKRSLTVDNLTISKHHAELWVDVSSKWKGLASLQLECKCKESSLNGVLESKLAVQTQPLRHNPCRLCLITLVGQCCQHRNVTSHPKVVHINGSNAPHSPYINVFNGFSYCCSCKLLFFNGKNSAETEEQIFSRCPWR